MNAVITAFVVLFATGQAKAEPWWHIFQPTKPKVVKKTKKHVKVRTVTTKPKFEIPKGYKVVDLQWWADYISMEARWDYYIPEDDYVWSMDGKYLVPIVVYRHYEDMANASVKQ